jgi:hypothetical protein
MRSRARTPGHSISPSACSAELASTLVAAAFKSNWPSQSAYGQGNSKNALAGGCNTCDCSAGVQVVASLKLRSTRICSSRGNAERKVAAAARPRRQRSRRCWRAASGLREESLNPVLQQLQGLGCAPADPIPGSARIPPRHRCAASGVVAFRSVSSSWQAPSVVSHDDNSAWPRGSPGDDEELKRGFNRAAPLPTLYSL